MTCRGLAYHDAAAYAGPLIAARAGALPELPPQAPPRCIQRLFLSTNDFMLYAFDLHDGKFCEDFGEGGMVDFKVGLGDDVLGVYLFILPVWCWVLVCCWARVWRAIR